MKSKILDRWYMLKRFNELPLWKQWVVVSAFGGSLVASILIKVMGEGIADFADFIALAVIWIGQWLLLRRVIPKASRWLWVSLIGGLLALVVGIIPADRVQDAIDGIESSPLGLAGIGPRRSALGYFLGSVVAGAGFGAGLGVAQWLVLRWQFLKADWWIVANALGFAGGMVLQDVTLFGTGMTLNLLLAVPGVTTALTLNWLLAKPPPEGPDTGKRPLEEFIFAIFAITALLFAAVNLLLGVLILVALVTGGDAPAELGVWVLVLMVFLGAPSAAMGIGLLKRRNWARVIMLVLVANNLLGLAMKYASASGGFAVCWTAFHVCVIWFLLRPRVVQVFAGAQTTEPAQPIPPPS